MADSELEHLTRRIPLVAYAASAGYRPSTRERAPGLTFLEHRLTQDAIAIGRTADRVWIYASLAECAPRPTEESPDAARQRLRDGIARTPDKGTIVEFEQHRLRMEGRPELALDAVCARLRAWLETSLERPARGPAEGPPRPEPHRERIAGGEALDPLGAEAKHAFHQRRYDWSLLPFGDHDAPVRDRLRRWDAAKHQLEEALGRPRAAPTLTPATGPKPDPTPPPRHAARERDTSPRNHRHYDWTPLGGERRPPGRDREPGR